MITIVLLIPVASVSKTKASNSGNADREDGM